MRCDHCASKETELRLGLCATCDGLQRQLAAAYKSANSNTYRHLRVEWAEREERYRNE